jgi:mediator of RNA polymerase II transcription subunit 12
MGIILDNLMKEHPENFIAPKIWSRCKDCLDNSNTSGDPSRRHSLDSIDRRNSKLRNPVSHTTSCNNPRRHLIDILDQCLYFNYSNVSILSCWDISDNKSLLARTVLEWTSSLFRPGLSKVYIGVRLLRLWSKSGLDVNHAILDFLSSSQDESISCKSSIYHLISELTRSGHFSTLGYLHWLIARGGLRGPADMAVDAPCITRLLAELPTHDMPDSIGRLRKILLKRAAFSVEDELETSDAFYSVIETSILASTSISEADQHRYTSDFENIVHKLPDLSRTIKSEIGLRLRGQVRHYTLGSEPALAEGWDATCTIHPEVFNLIRKTLEAIQDTTMLADVLKFVSTSNNMRVLSSASDTLNLHFNELAAIGASRNIFNCLVRQRRFSVGESLDSVMLLKSLCDAAERFPDAGGVFLQLSDELGCVTHKTAADACSPVSDYMAEVFQKSENDFTDEIEKVLTSGTSMDSSTMSRLFQVLILRTEVVSEKGGQELRSCAILLSRLRAFDSKHFDSLLGSWLDQLIRSKDRPPLAHVLGYLISLGCLDFRSLLKSLTAFAEDSASQMDITIAAKTSMEGLSMFVNECDTEGSMMTDEDAYRLKIKRLLATKLSRVEVLNLIRCAVELSTRLDDDQTELYALSHRNSFRDLFRTFVLMDIESVSAALVTPLAKSPDSKILGFINTLVGSLLGYAEHSSLEYNFPDRVKMAMALANDITMPFCQMELRLIFASDLSNLTPEQIGQAGSLQAFEETIDAAVAEDNTTWTSIIPKIDGQIAQHICHRAERMFLHLVPSAKTSNPSDPALLENYDVGNRMLFVVNATSHAMESIRNLSTVAQIVDKLNDILQLALQPGQEMQLVIEKWLPLMLDFIILHVGDFETIKLGSEARSRILLMLSALLLDFQCSSDKTKALLSRVFDVALLLVDDLPEDSRIQCIRILKERTSDPALRYIFGYRTPATHWLQLQQKGKLTPYPLRRWEILSEPTPNVGENDTSLSLTLFKARRL